MSLEDTKEFIHHKKSLHLIDGVYKEVFKDAKIKRFEYDEQHILDREFHIDTELVFPNQIKILGQEKCLGAEWYKYKTFTIEFYQNRHTKERGEFFNIAAQFYLHGYSNETYTELLDWHIIKLFDFMLWLRMMSIEELEKNTNPSGGSNASFYYIPYQDIPTRFIFRSKADQKK